MRQATPTPVRRTSTIQAAATFLPAKCFQANVEHGSVNVQRFSRQAMSLIVHARESHGATVSSLVAIQKEDIPLDIPLDTKTFALLEREERRIARAEQKTRRR
ncbi:hypothetical protein EKN07_09205 [Actinobaculum sp. 352]|nr:hypothetical protein EKN07_09205 [Actinobaculum sp. 352]